MNKDTDKELVLALIGQLREVPSYFDDTLKGYRWANSFLTGTPTDIVIQINLKSTFARTVPLTKLRVILNELIEEGLVKIEREELYNKSLKIYVPTSLLLMLEQA